MSAGKYFTIHSHLNGLVLDVSGNKANPNTPVITWPEKKDGENNNQQWFYDSASKSIRSKLNPEYCLDLNGKYQQLEYRWHPCIIVDRIEIAAMSHQSIQVVMNCISVAFIWRISPARIGTPWWEIYRRELSLT